MRFKASEFASLIQYGALYNGNSIITGISTDSGDVKAGDMFVCIKGERTDGHKYVDLAINNGASCVLSDRLLSVDIPYILVPDTVKALQDAARTYRKTLDVKIVAVTGSVGKTTTKELIASALSSLAIHKTSGNKNSETGVPITVLGIDKKDAVAVVEMGMSNLGEISLLSSIACPDVGVITNIGFSHIENLKTRENILKAKLEILDGMTSSSPLILNGDDNMLRSLKTCHKKVIYYSSTDKNADYYAYDIEENEKSSSFSAKTPIGNFKVEVNLPGRHNVLNSLAAIAVGEEFGLSAKDIVLGISKYKATALRQNIYKFKDVTVYDDCYNSAPNSLKASIDTLSKMKGRKVAVLGDMLELGEMSEALHERAGEELSEIDIIYLYGDYAESFASGAVKGGVDKKNIMVFNDKKELARTLIKNTRAGDVILFKASRGMKAEDIIKDFSENY